MPADLFSPLELVDNGDETFTLLRAFRYRDIIVPAGFRTDFASVPRLVWNIIPPYGRHGKAAVVHDYLYSLRGHLPNGQRYTRAECDSIFREAMDQLAVRWTRRQTMWLAVRAFGWRAWSHAPRGINPQCKRLHSPAAR